MEVPFTDAATSRRDDVIPPPEKYENSFDYLCDEFRRLDVMIERQLFRLRARQPANPLEQFKGLVVSEEEVAALLAKKRRTDSPSGETSPYSSEIESCAAGALREVEQSIQSRLQRSLEANVNLSLPRLAQLLGLTAFESDCLLICLAPELDRKYEKLYAYLQDDVTRKKPTLDLVLALTDLSPKDRVVARASLASHAPLLRHRLVQVQEAPPDSPTPLLSRPLKLDDRIVNFLLDQPQMDARLEPFARLLFASDESDSVTVNERLRERVIGFLHRGLNRDSRSAQKVLFHFHGPAGVGKHALARTVAEEFGLPLLLADAGRMLSGPLPFEEAALLLAREALLQPALLCIENLDALLSGDERHQAQLKTLAETLLDFTHTAFLLGRRSWTPSGLGDDRLFSGDNLFISVPFVMPNDVERTRIWRETLGAGAEVGHDMDCDTLAGKFRFSAGQIRRAWQRACHQHAWDNADGKGRISVAALSAACRAESDQSLAAHAKKIVPKYTWADIVLPEDASTQLREICQRVAHRQLVLGRWGFDRKLSHGKGVNALFAGPSGTGKTMAAEIIAGELGLDLYRIDLSAVVSKYIGETEKNLDRIFTAAESANAILFFDEADALFGKRSEVRDSHDRYANIEISYLLQKMEEYEGVAILATNLRQNLDESFVRRLAFTIHFPFPEEADRRRIWSAIWPREIPLAPDLDFDFLSRQFKLSGGNIKNIALAAAFLAAEDGGVVTMSHLRQATQREYQKLGKALTPAELGQPEIENRA